MTPIILADNRYLDGAITATGVTDDSRLAIIDGRPYTWLEFPSGGTKYISVDCGSAKNANALAIIGHNLATISGTLSLESSTNGSTWTERLHALTPASDRALLRVFTRVQARYWRIVITSVAAARIAVAMVGERIDFEYPPDAPFVPWSESVEAEQNDSKAGHALGVVVRYFPITIKPSFSMVTRSWLESVYLPFRQDHGRWRKYFFWAWDLETCPDQVFYVQDSGSYAPDVSVLDYYNKLTIDLRGVMEL